MYAKAVTYDALALSEAVISTAEWLRFRCYKRYAEESLVGISNTKLCSPLISDMFAAECSFYYSSIFDIQPKTMLDKVLGYPAESYKGQGFRPGNSPYHPLQTHNHLSSTIPTNKQT